MSSDPTRAAEPASDDFLDVDDLPPWGTRLARVEIGTSGGLIACWVPRVLVAASGLACPRPR